jgi:hypothetical protein
MKVIICFLAFVLTMFNVIAQEKKSVEALYITTPLVIDGVLDEPVYKQAKPAKDFVQMQPYNGKASFQPSEVYFFYDQTAIYVGAMLYDSAPDSIFNFLSERDDIWASDYFGVYLDPYNQGQLAYGFFVNVAGVQADLKATKSDGDNEDGNWNAVWESKTRLTDKGWVVEMRIPYSALRFPKNNASAWGLNMFRNIKRYNSNNTWNFVDRNVSGFIHQEGQLTGIKDIKPPVRLSFSPYASAYVETNKGEQPDFLYKGGLDLKYGLSESFTLDMMVIPDFGQIQSDDERLNLTPYELYYDEKRQFFTEGTELFQRGNIFYSRRIGAAPKFPASDALAEHEMVDNNPSETQLINATKISGRTSDGWGLGMLNAMTSPSYATLKDTITGSTRRTLVQPFTNYNVSVIDKSLKNNSYISLINSNMLMVDNPFRANVTATEFQIRNKAKSFAIKGKAGISTRGDTCYETGYYSYLGVSKNKGKLQYGISQNIYSDKYNPNDLGYLQLNNQLLTESYILYQIIKPFWIIREWWANIWWDYIRMYTPSTLFENQIGSNANVLFKNNYSIYANGGLGGNKYDYYEPRVTGRYFYYPYYFWYNLNLNTDNRKPVNFYFHYGGYKHPVTDKHGYWGDANVNIRIGQRFQAGYSVSFNNTFNDEGFVDKNDNEDSIYFARRNVKTLENILSASYAFNNKTTVKIRVRHYWSGVKNKQFYLLQNDGLLENDFAYSHDDENYNAFTIDMIFRWIFAPGSEMTLAWKNSAYADDEDFMNNYWRNLKNTWSNQSNSLSLKVLYYIDYNSLKKKK